MSALSIRRRPSIPLLAGIAAAAGSLTAVAVPAIQGVVVWRTSRPSVTGPHDQDGLIGAVPTRADGGPEPLPLSLIWLGDSLASGVGAGSPDSSFPRRAAALTSVAEGRSVHLTCLARPGARASDVIADQLPNALDRLGPGCVAVVTVGANDVGSLRRPRRFRREYTKILTALGATGATVIAVGLPHMGSAAVMARPLRTIVGVAGRHADRSVRQLAARHDAHYVHIAVRAPWGTDPATYLAPDRWHPNDATYQMWADRVAERLHPLLVALRPPVLT